MHNSRWSSLQSEMFSLDCFGQHAPSDEQCMQRSQAGGRTDSAQTQTQQKEMDLCCNANGPGAFCFKESWTKVYNFLYCQLKKNVGISFKIDKFLGSQVLFLHLNFASVTVSSAQQIFEKWCLSPSLYLDLWRDAVWALADGLIASSVEWQLLKGFLNCTRVDGCLSAGQWTEFGKGEGEKAEIGEMRVKQRVELEDSDPDTKAYRRKMFVKK